MSYDSDNSSESSCHSLARYLQKRAGFPYNPALAADDCSPLVTSTFVPLCRDDLLSDSSDDETRTETQKSFSGIGSDEDDYLPADFLAELAGESDSNFLCAASETGLDLNGHSTASKKFGSQREESRGHHDFSATTSHRRYVHQHDKWLSDGIGVPDSDVRLNGRDKHYARSVPATNIHTIPTSKFDQMSNYSERAKPLKSNRTSNILGNNIRVNGRKSLNVYDEGLARATNPSSKPTFDQAYTYSPERLRRPNFHRSCDSLDSNIGMNEFDKLNMHSDRSINSTPKFDQPSTCTSKRLKPPKNVRTSIRMNGRKPLNVYDERSARTSINYSKFTFDQAPTYSSEQLRRPNFHRSCDSLGSNIHVNGVDRWNVYNDRLVGSNSKFDQPSPYTSERLKPPKNIRTFDILDNNVHVNGRKEVNVYDEGLARATNPSSKPTFDQTRTYSSERLRRPSFHRICDMPSIPSYHGRSGSVRDLDDCGSPVAAEFAYEKPRDHRDFFVDKNEEDYNRWQQRHSDFQAKKTKNGKAVSVTSNASMESSLEQHRNYAKYAINDDFYDFYVSPRRREPKKQQCSRFRLTEEEVESVDRVDTEGYGYERFRR